MEILIPIITDTLELFYLYIGKGISIKFLYIVNLDRSLFNFTATNAVVQLDILFARILHCCENPNA